MIDYFTCLKLKRPLSDEEFDSIVEEGKVKLLSKPLAYGFCGEIVPVEDAGGVSSLSDSSGNIRTLRYRILYNNGASYQHTWTLEREQGILTAYCETVSQDEERVEPCIAGDLLFGPLSDMGCLDKDWGFPVSGKAQPITYSTMDRAVSLIMREDQCSLPVIYLATTKNYQYMLDPNELAQKYVGFAHVVYEASDCIYGHLKGDTYSRNPNAGTIAIFCPGRRRIIYIGRKYEEPEKAKKKIEDTLRGYMRSIHIQEKDSYLGLINRNLEHEKKGLEEDRAKIEKENREIYDVFDSELEKNKDKMQRILFQNSELQKENLLLKQQLVAVKNPALLLQGNTEECFPGETRNMVLDALNNALSSCMPGSRREQVIQDVLDANNFNDSVQKRREEIKMLFRKHEVFNNSMALELQRLGFCVERDGNHIILRYRNCPQIVAVPKTPSDPRSMTNLSFDIIRTFF